MGDQFWDYFAASYSWKAEMSDIKVQKLIHSVKTACVEPSPKLFKLISFYEERFFKDLSNYGTHHIVCLAYDATYADGSRCRRFYQCLKGERSDPKHRILNQCLCAVLLRWLTPDYN